MYSVGLITFHASYNFGSVMQAWVTQKIVSEMGYDCEIINFRTKIQKDKYSVFPIKMGYKQILRDIVQIPWIGDKYRSNKKYEKFIQNKLAISKEYNTVEDLKTAKKYDIYLAGSDQIWGYHIPEFDYSKIDVRGIYYFNFVDGYKISYASSTGTATSELLQSYAEYLKKFSHLAVRESIGQQVIGNLTGQKPSVVLDPTYLISSKAWCEIANSIPRKYEYKYVLIYSLQGMKKAKKWKELIGQLPSYIKIITVVPFSPVTGKGIINRADAGPIEILSLFANAEYVYTDTFHGMSFAIHFRKPFTIFEDTDSDSRKRNIMKIFSLSDRETNLIDSAVEMFSSPIDYDSKEHLISSKVVESLDYLKNALGDYEQFRDINS